MLKRRGSSVGVEAAGYKRGTTTRVGFWIPRVLAQDFTSAAIRRDGQCVFYGLEALLRKANFLMVAYRRRLCVGWFFAVWIFLLECVGESVVCDTIVGWSIQGTHHLNGCFRGHGSKFQGGFSSNSVLKKLKKEQK